jgi:hypothetical protein
MPSAHRNLRTRKRMHLCMQDDQIGRKFMELAPAEMARPPHSITAKKFLVVNNLVHQLGLHLFWTCLALLGKSSIFWLDILLLVLRFLCFRQGPYYNKHVGSNELCRKLLQKISVSRFVDSFANYYFFLLAFTILLNIADIFYLFQCICNIWELILLKSNFKTVNSDII